MPGPAPPPAPAPQIKQAPGLNVNQRNLPDHYNNRPQYSNNNNRNGYGQQQPRTYHAGNDDQAQYYGETQQYQAYEDGYYGTADFTGNDYVTVDTDEDGPTDKDDTHDDTVESHFTSPLPPGPSSRTIPSKKTFQCTKCNKCFDSNSKLHQHIRTGIHYHSSHVTG
ncbi:hypothetical protein Q9189_005296 [Teloschistes chrysophthalmus]